MAPRHRPAQPVKSSEISRALRNRASISRRERSSMETRCRVSVIRSVLAQGSAAGKERPTIPKRIFATSHLRKAVLSLRRVFSARLHRGCRGSICSRFLPQSRARMPPRSSLLEPFSTSAAHAQRLGLKRIARPATQVEPPRPRLALSRSETTARAPRGSAKAETAPGGGSGSRSAWVLSTSHPSGTRASAPPARSSQNTTAALPLRAKAAA